MNERDAKYDSTIPILRNDRVFKRFFKKNIDKLIYLINSASGYEFEKDELEFIDTEIPINSLHNKDSRLDLFLKTKQGEYINIEVQNVVTDQFDIRRNIFSYLALTHKIKRSKDYDVGKTISISIVYDTRDLFSKSLINFQKYDRISLEIEKNGVFIKDKILIDEFIINLAKLDSDDRIKGNEKEFFKLFNIKHLEELKNMCEKNGDFKEIYEGVIEITQDEIYDVESLMLEKDRRDAYVRDKELKKNAREEGIEQGIEQGIKEGIEQGIEQGIKEGIEQGIEQGIAKKQKEVIISLYKNKMDIEFIATTLKIKKEDVKIILKENNIL